MNSSVGAINGATNLKHIQFIQRESRLLIIGSFPLHWFEIYRLTNLRLYFIIKSLDEKTTTLLWYLLSCKLFLKGLYSMPRGLQASHPLIANMILFINISKFLKWKIYLHDDIGILEMIVLRLNMQGKISLSILMASVICLRFNMQGHDLLEHTNAMCHCPLLSTCRPLYNIGTSW